MICCPTAPNPWITQLATKDVSKVFPGLVIEADKTLARETLLSSISARKSCYIHHSYCINHSPASIEHKQWSKYKIHVFIFQMLWNGILQYSMVFHVKGYANHKICMAPQNTRQNQYGVCISAPARVD